MTSFEGLLRKRRSIRVFEEQKVRLFLIREIIGGRAVVPSASHKQPWHFIIVNNRDVMKRLSDESKRTLFGEIEANPELPRRGYRGAMENAGFNILYNAPSLVYIIGRSDAWSLEVDGALPDVRRGPALHGDVPGLPGSAHRGPRDQGRDRPA